MKKTMSKIALIAISGAVFLTTLTFSLNGNKNSKWGVSAAIAQTGGEDGGGESVGGTQVTEVWDLKDNYNFSCYQGKGIFNWPSIVGSSANVMTNCGLWYPVIESADDSEIYQGGESNHRNVTFDATYTLPNVGGTLTVFEAKVLVFQ